MAKKPGRGKAPTFDLSAADRKALDLFHALNDLEGKYGPDTMLRTMLVQVAHLAMKLSVDKPSYDVWLDRIMATQIMMLMTFRERMPDHTTSQ